MESEEDSARIERRERKNLIEAAKMWRFGETSRACLVARSLSGIVIYGLYSGSIGNLNCIPKLYLELYFELYFELHLEPSGCPQCHLTIAPNSLYNCINYHYDSLYGTQCLLRCIHIIDILHSVKRVAHK